MVLVRSRIRSPRQPDRGRAQLATLVRIVQALVAWVALIWVAYEVGDPMRRRIKIGTPPLVGGVLRLDSEQTSVVLSVLAVVAGGLVLARWLPSWCARLPWRWLLVAIAVVALGWGMAVALLRGTPRLDHGLASRYEYPAVVDDVERLGVGPFIDTFSDPDVLGRYPVHVQGHPVGTPLLFVALDRVGLGGAEGGATFVLAATLLTVPAVLVAVREVAGEAAARWAAPFLALPPGVIWAVTSADALFTAVGALAVMSVVLATSTSRSPRGRTALAVAGGVAFGVGIHLTYGLVPLVVIPVAVAVARRCWTALAGAALGGAAVVAAFSAAGFFWLDGLAATHTRYLLGVAPHRPFAYFALLANPAAFALAVGPAAFVALRVVRDRRIWLLGGAGLAAVVISDLSGLSKGEVERIWLPFVPWILVLTGGLAGALGKRRPTATAVDDEVRDEGIVGDSGDDDDGNEQELRTQPGWVNGLLVAQVLTAVAVEATVLTLW